MSEPSQQDQEGFKIVTIQLESGQVESYPVKFYDGTDQGDIQTVMKETIANLKDFTQNQNLKAWSPQKETANGNTTTKQPEPQEFLVGEQIVLSEMNPSVRGSPQKQYREVKSLNHQFQDEVEVGGQDLATHANKAQAVRSAYPEQEEKTEAPLITSTIGNYIYHPTHPNLVVKSRPDNSIHVHLRMKASGKKQTDKNSSNEKGKKNLFEKVEAQAEEEVATFIIPKREIPQFITGSLCNESQKGTIVYIYTPDKVLMPFSYIRYTGEPDIANPKLPAPTYIKHSVLAAPKHFVKDEIFKGLEITKKGELKLVDKEILERQKGIASEVLRRLAGSIAAGRGVVGVSLPVRIFEPRSMLERVCDWFTFIPKYGIDATKVTSDPIERMKKVISMAIGGLYVSAKQVKPFNPLLGETFQARFPDHGIEIEMEHTSHHPPIANFMLTHDDFRFWGRYIFKADMSMTGNLSMIMDGPNNMDFADGTRITFNWPQLKLSGMLWGDRMCKYHQTMIFIDRKNGLKAFLEFGEYGNRKEYKNRVDAFTGSIYTFDPQVEAQLMAKEKFKDIEQKQKDKIKDVVDVFGLYLEFLEFDGKKAWDINKDTPVQYFPIENPLPSDCRFREDLIFVKSLDFKLAENWKLKLEERQRHERKLREEFQKKQKKK